MFDIIDILLVVIHIVAVICWIGGLIFFDIILQPTITLLSPNEAVKLSQGVTKRLMPLISGAIIIVAATGLLVIGYRGALSFNILFVEIYGNVILIKIILFVAMLAIGLIIARIGLQFAKHAKLISHATLTTAYKVRKQIRLLSRITIILGIIEVYLGVMLRISTG